MKRIVTTIALTVGLAVAGPASAQDSQNLSIVTGGTGGVYYPLGGGLANLLTQYVEGWQATAEVTGGSVDNLNLVGAERSDIAFAMADAVLEAQEGQGAFDGNPQALQALAVLYPNRMHVVTTTDTGIESVADLEGKRVSTGSQGSATEVMAFRVLEAAGLDPASDIQQERLGAAESTNALKDGKIEAYFWVGGVPTAAVTDLAATPGTTIKLVDHADLIEAMNAEHGQLYSAGVIAAETYPGQTADNQQANVWNVLVVNEAMDEETAYQVVKTMFEHQEEWATVHQAAREVTVDNQLQANTPVAFHPGALRYFEEQGIQVGN